MAIDQSTESVLQGDYLDYDEPVDRVAFDFALSRRRFVQILGAGLLIAVCEAPAGAQTAPSGKGGRSGKGGGSAGPVAARIHIGRDGKVTVMTGKVEGGQGSRAELTQAAAEELRLPVARINLVMADTDLVPNDGITAGSRTTPSTVPAVRQGAAAARMLLVDLAAGQWGVPAAEVEVREGIVIHAPSRREQSYADLAASPEAGKVFGQNVPGNVTVTPVRQWKTMGVSTPRPNRRDLATGAHEYPSDITLPGMLYGKVLRAPSYGAKLTAIDLAPAKGMKDVVVVRDGSFVGVTAPTTFAAQRALEAIAATAQWEPAAHPPSEQVYDHLRRRARSAPANPFAETVSQAAKSLKQTYHVAYVQHAPMEPRAAVAQWEDGKVTVWTASQNPFGVRREVAGAFRIGEDKVQVIIPDFGGGFGGKHTGESAVEAARLAQGAGRPVCLRWTRAEEFTWAAFRPAAVIDAEASLDAEGNVSSWHFVNINSGQSAAQPPYRFANTQSQYVQSEPPLRHGSYRALAATANNFARECFMDELAEAAGRDALAFRLAHLENDRLRAVLEKAAKEFDWPGRSKRRDQNVGVGLACGTEKGSVVAACVEVLVDRAQNRIVVRRVCEAFECGAIINPDNLLAQVNGCILMALGPALREEMRFEEGRILNAAFSRYLVPRFEDVPELDIHLVDRPDLASAGAGETPIIALAPAIANAVYRVTGKRVRQMPIRLGEG